MHGGDRRGRDAARERQSYVRHELRAPLAVMYPLISMLLEGQTGHVTDEQRQYLEILQRNAERLEARIASATDTGWLDCATASMVIEAVSLDDVVDEMLTQRRLSRQTRPRIEVDRGPGPCVAMADRHDVRHVLAALIANAARAVTTDGVVLVSAAADETTSFVSLTVRDDGRGMSEDDLAIAGEFGSSDGDGSRPGLGIGLWVCRELLGRNSGRLEIASEEGKGTSVTAVLPSALVG